MLLFAAFSTRRSVVALKCFLAGPCIVCMKEREIKKLTGKITAKQDKTVKGGTRKSFFFFFFKYLIVSISGWVPSMVGRTCWTNRLRRSWWKMGKLWESSLKERWAVSSHVYVHIFMHIRILPETLAWCWIPDTIWNMYCPVNSYSLCCLGLIGSY